MNNTEHLLNDKIFNTFNIISFLQQNCLLYALEDSLSIHFNGGIKRIAFHECIIRSQGPKGSVLTSVNAMKYVFDGYCCIKNVVFWLNFESIFGTILF